MSGPQGTPALTVRELRRSDVTEVVRIDASHTGEPKPDYWAGVFNEFLSLRGERVRIGLGADVGGGLAGYLLGEVRAFEFGSEPCGWIFSVAVDKNYTRHGVATTLITEACSRFRAQGVERIRTMVRREDIPVLSFFRASGFVGGPFVQLELNPPEEAS